MSEAKHTPGPWAWENGSLQYGDGKWLSSPSGMVLDYAGCGSHECDIKEADARLIAAAPELLEALEQIVWKLERKEMVASCPERFEFAKIDINDAVIRLARAAIAKVESGVQHDPR